MEEIFTKVDLESEKFLPGQKSDYFQVDLMPRSPGRMFGSVGSQSSAASQVKC